MEIAFITDTQLKEYSQFSYILDSGPHAGYNSRLAIGIQVLEEFGRFCIDRRIEHVIHGGDLLDEIGRIQVTTLSLVYPAVLDLVRKVRGLDRSLVLNLGNHGRGDRGMVDHAGMMFAGVEGITVVQQPTAIWYDDALFYFVPYTHDKDLLVQRIRGIKQVHSEENFNRRKHKCVLVIHNGVDGMKLGSTEYSPDEFIDANERWFRPFDLVLAGHTHRHQELTIGKTPIVVVGASHQHRFDDEGQERGFITLDTDDLSWEYHRTSAPEFRRFEVASTKDLDAMSKEDLTNCFVKVTLKTEKVTAADIRDLKFAAPPIIDHDYSVPDLVRIDMPSNTGLVDAAEAYVEHVIGPKKPNRAKRLKKLGLRLIQESGAEI